MPSKKKLRSLRFFVFLLVGTIVMVFALSIFTIFDFTMPKMLLESENKYFSRQISVASGLLASARESITLLAEDTAIWDETVQFARGENPDYIAKNWTDTSLLQSFRVNFIVIKNAEGKTIYTDFINLRTKEVMTIPSKLAARLDDLARSVLAGYEGGMQNKLGKEGLLFVDNTTYDVAAMPIVVSRKSETPSGTLILGTVCDNAYFQSLTHYTAGTFAIVKDTDTTYTATTPIQRIGDNSISTHMRIASLDGTPLVLTMTEARQIYTAGWQFLTRANFMLLAALVLFAVLLYNALVRLLLLPIERLSKDIQKIAESETIDSAHLPIEKYSKTSDFAILCTAINGMLKNLGQSRISLGVLESTLNGINADLCVVNPEDNTILFMNDKMSEHYNVVGNAEGRICWEVLQPGATEICSFCPQQDLLQNPDSSVTWETTNAVSGRTYTKTDSLIRWTENKLMHLQHSIDITSLKESEATLQKRLDQQELMSEMSRSFISSADMTYLISNALRMVGDFMGVSKIVLACAHEDTGALSADYRWCNPKDGCAQPIEKERPFHPGIFEHEKFIVRKEPYLAYDDITNMEEFAYACSLGVKSRLSVPVPVFGDFWGMLSFDECAAIRHWSESDIQLATFIGSVIAGVVERSSTELKLVRMSSIVDSSPQFISCLDIGGKVEYANHGTAGVLGYTADELLANGMGMLFDEEANTLMQQTVVPRVLAEGRHSFELPVKRKDGEERILAFSAFTINHRTIGIGSIAMDVTRQRAMEKEILAAKDHAEKSSMAKGEFLSRMSHEMRTPLNAIIGMTSIATAARDLEKKQYCLDKIGDASSHLLGVINDILDMSKIEANKFELSCSEFTLEKMLMRALNVVNFRIDEKEQVLGVNIDPEIPYSVIADEQRLAQVIANLLSNAVKFTPEKGSITLGAKKIAEEDGYATLLIDVTDTGIGIPKEHQSKLFNSFEQADGGISRKFGGTGLGLAISKRIIEMMDGEIWIESEPGKGSRFAFTFKVQCGGTTRKNALCSGIHWEDLKILVVDDAPDVREYFLTLANSLGFFCTVAASGPQACAILESAGKETFDAIFVDWKMPGMNGVELATRIRETSASDGVVIMISATEWSDIEKDAKAAGVARFVPKPLFSSSIVDCLSECLGEMGDCCSPFVGSKTEGVFTGAKILLVEDIEINREIVITLLDDTGLAIDCAENGQIACDMFRAAPKEYSMIFMDIHMPEIDGYEATRRIRAMSDIPQATTIPIIAMTANVFREDIERCLTVGMNGHIGKPINFDEMFDKLREYCSAQN